jgi:hypothetical protein
MTGNWTIYYNRAINTVYKNVTPIFLDIENQLKAQFRKGFGKSWPFVYLEIDIIRLGWIDAILYDDPDD